jgi:outer membrane protein OmpA-like peptidoglycan-associated protein
MKRSTSGDYISSSLTDLMTSLLVIFILLLVAKLNTQAIGTGRTVEYVANRLNAAQLFNAGEEVHQNGDVIVVVVSQELMSFKEAKATQGGADLSPAGKAYLRDTIPKLASVVCRDDVRKYIDTIIVEGHADKKGFGNGNGNTDSQENLILSQQRSMAVVSESLSVLGKDRACFLDLLSATGRGDAHPLNRQDLYAPENRRVELRIRVRPDLASSIADRLEGIVEK